MNEAEMMSPFDYGDSVRVVDHTDPTKIGMLGSVIGYWELLTPEIVNGISYPKGEVLIWVEAGDGSDDHYAKTMLAK